MELRGWEIFTDHRSPLLRCAIAVASVALALGIASLLSPRADPSHFTLFFAAVMVSSWYGGLGAGLLATVLSALSLDYYFVDPIHSIAVDWRALLRISTFIMVAIIPKFKKIFEDFGTELPDMTKLLIGMMPGTIGTLIPAARHESTKCQYASAL